LQLSLFVGTGSAIYYYYYYYLPRVRREQADREVKAIPVYRAMSEADPQTYQKILALIVDGIEKGENIDAISGKIAPIFF